MGAQDKHGGERPEKLATSEASPDSGSGSSRAATGASGASAIDKPAQKTRYEQAQDDLEARFGPRPKYDPDKPKAPWRGKPRKKRKKRGPVDLGKLVFEQLRKHIPAASLRLERLQQRWPALVPPSIARRTWPAKFYGQRLLVLVHDNQWLHELGYLQQDILDRLQRDMPDAGVAELILRLGTIPPPRVLHTSRDWVAPAYKAPLSGEVPTQTQTAIDSVKDPDLRAAISAAREALGRQRPENAG